MIDPVLPDRKKLSNAVSPTLNIQHGETTFIHSFVTPKTNARMTIMTRKFLEPLIAGTLSSMQPSKAVTKLPSNNI